MHIGLFKYRQADGISSAPPIFQRVMAKVLKGLQEICVYMDDILVTEKDDNEHIENLSAVFQRLQQNGLRIKKRSALSANSPCHTWDMLWLLQQ